VEDKEHQYAPAEKDKSAIKDYQKENSKNLLISEEKVLDKINDGETDYKKVMIPKKSNYKTFYSKKAFEFIKAQDRTKMKNGVLLKILTRIRELKESPHKKETLYGASTSKVKNFSGIFITRIGDFRYPPETIIYELDEKNKKISIILIKEYNK